MRMLYHNRIRATARTPKRVTSACADEETVRDLFPTSAEERAWRKIIVEREKGRPHHVDIRAKCTVRNIVSVDLRNFHKPIKLLSFCFMGDFVLCHATPTIDGKIRRNIVVRLSAARISRFYLMIIICNIP